LYLIFHTLNRSIYTKFYLSIHCSNLLKNFILIDLMNYFISTFSSPYKSHNSKYFLKTLYPLKTSSPFTYILNSFISITPYIIIHISLIVLFKSKKQSSQSNNPVLEYPPIIEYL